MTARRSISITLLVSSLCQSMPVLDVQSWASRVTLYDSWRASVDVSSIDTCQNEQDMFIYSMDGVIIPVSFIASGYCRGYKLALASAEIRAGCLIKQAPTGHSAYFAELQTGAGPRQCGKDHSHAHVEGLAACPASAHPVPDI